MSRSPPKAMLCNYVTRSWQHLIESTATTTVTHPSESKMSEEEFSNSLYNDSSLNEAIKKEHNNITDVTQSWYDWLESTSNRPLSHSRVLEEEYIPSWKFPDELQGLYQTSKIGVTRRKSVDTHTLLTALAVSCSSSRSNKPNLRKRKIPGGYVEELDLEPTKQLDEFINRRTQSVLFTSEVLKANANAVQSRKAQNRVEGKKQKTNLEATLSIKQPIRKNSTNRKAPVQHILLGNDSALQKESIEEINDEQYLYFIPDFNTELHQKLTMLEVEYAWLLEESFYLYQTRDEPYLYNYASPHLKISFRKNTILVKPNHQADFDILRQDIRRRLRQGRRRGPIMSRVMAQLRFQNRQKAALAAANTLTVDQTMNMVSDGEKNSIVRDLPCHSLLILGRDQMKKKGVGSDNSLVLSKPLASAATGANLQWHSVTSKNSSSPTNEAKAKLTKSKGRKRHEKMCGSKNSGSANRDAHASVGTIQRPVSKLLTDMEMEVAWLAEESSVLDPINGPLLSYIEMHASDDLKATMSVALGASHSRRWLPRLYRGYDATIKQEFGRMRDLIRNALKEGYRRPETAGVLPREYIPPPVAIRVRQSYNTFLSSGS